MGTGTKAWLPAALMVALLNGCGAGTDDAGPASGDTVNKSSTGYSANDSAERTAKAAAGTLDQLAQQVLAQQRTGTSGRTDAARLRSAMPPGSSLQRYLRGDGIAAELFAAMLLRSENTEAVQALASDFPGASAPPVRVNPAPIAPQVQASQTLDLSGGATPMYRVNSEMWRRSEPWDGAVTPIYPYMLNGADLRDYNAAVRFSFVDFNLPLDLDPLSHTSAPAPDGNPDLSPLNSLQTGTVFLGLNRTMQVNSTPWSMNTYAFIDTSRVGGSGTTQSLQLASLHDLRLKRGQIIPYGRVVQRWRDGRGHYVQLFLLRGQQPGEMRVCWDFNVPQARRWSCSIWQPDRNWAPGKSPAFKGYHVIDDRGARGQTGLTHWLTMAPAPRVHQPVGVDGGPWTAAPAHSSTGVNGDVLATMLTQSVADVAGLHWDSHGPGGSAVAASALRPLDISQKPTFEPPLHTPAFARGIWMSQDQSIRYGLPWATYPSFRNLASYLHLKANLGSFGSSNGKITSYHLGGLDQVATGTPILSLEHNAYVGVGPAASTDRHLRFPKTWLALQPVRTQHVRKNVAVGFNQRIQQWRASNGTTLSLHLLPGARSNEVWSCLTLEGGAPIWRRTCNIWQIPADWKLGQSLVYLGTHIRDDRKFASGPWAPPSGPAMLSWQGTPGINWKSTLP